MKFIAISDTHGKHEGLELPEGDCILHAGDVCSRGTRKEALDFLDWFGKLDYQYKVFIAGNHDFFFERFHAEVDDLIPDGVVYLNDAGVEIEGIKIYGSPVQPWFFNWAFNRERGPDIDRYWQLIPADTDILITHGPPYGILDKTVKGELVGCADLMNKVKELEPKVHIFGHIHEAYGEAKLPKTHFINASVLNVNYRLVNEPVVFELGSS